MVIILYEYGISFKDFVFSEHKLRQYVKNLKPGCARGSDVLVLNI